MENEKYEFRGIGLTRQETFSGKKKFEEYCGHYHIEAYSDLQMVEELVYQEIMQERLKEKITTLEEKYRKEQKEYSVPRHVVETMKINFEQILIIKDKLGMFENKENAEGYAYIQILRNKFKKWCENNQASRTAVCPHCSRMIALFIRPETWEAHKYPFFKDKLLYNEHLVKLYQDKIISSKDVSKILGCSDKYVEWLIKKWNGIQQKNINEN